MMSTAVADDLIARNPCCVEGAGVERAPERPIPTGDEVWKLADAIEERYRALVLTAAFVGLRWGELIGLRRADVDLDNRVVHVERQFVEVKGQLIEGPPKSAAGLRAVAIPPALVPEFRAHLERFTGPGPTALVFVGVKGSALRRTNFTRIWKAARLEVGRTDLHVHDLRHYANTLAASAGASTRELMVRLGHSSPAAALRYQHATAERDRVIADRMNEMIEGTAPSRVSLRVLPAG